jgi:hypothetical protein
MAKTAMRANLLKAKGIANHHPQTQCLPRLWRMQTTKQRFIRFAKKERRGV